MVSAEDVRTVALSLPETNEKSSYGMPGFRVRKKGFARLHEQSGVLVLWCADVGEKEALIASEPEKFFTTPHYDGYSHVLVNLDRIDTDELLDLLTASWRSRAPKRLVEEFDTGYDEGLVFAIPLREGGGFGVGLVARKGGGWTALGYLFGPRWQQLPTLDGIGELCVQDALDVHMFGDASLRDGAWPRIGPLPTWDREAWPVPAFGQLNPLFEDLAFRLEYSDTLEFERELPVSHEEFKTLPNGGVWGAGAVELQMTTLLKDNDDGAGSVGSWTSD